VSRGVRVGKAKVIRATDKALLVQLEADDEGHQRWIPKSGVHDDSEVFDGKDNSEGDLVLEAWLAEKEGLD
jgi:hypothetical protein